MVERRRRGACRKEKKMVDRCRKNERRDGTDRLRRNERMEEKRRK